MSYLHGDGRVHQSEIERHHIDSHMYVLMIKNEEHRHRISDYELDSIEIHRYKPFPNCEIHGYKPFSNCETELLIISLLSAVYIE